MKSQVALQVFSNVGKAFIEVIMGDEGPYTVC